MSSHARMAAVEFGRFLTLRFSGGAPPIWNLASWPRSNVVYQADDIIKYYRHDHGHNHQNCMFDIQCWNIRHDIQCCCLFLCHLLLHVTLMKMSMPRYWIEEFVSEFEFWGLKKSIERLEFCSNFKL